jgi:hypothetical protein
MASLRHFESRFTSALGVCGFEIAISFEFDY